MVQLNEDIVRGISRSSVGVLLQVYVDALTATAVATATAAAVGTHIMITAVFGVSLLHPPGSEVYLQHVSWSAIISSSCDKLTSRTAPGTAVYGTKSPAAHCDCPLIVPSGYCSCKCQYVIVCKRAAACSSGRPAGIKRRKAVNVRLRTTRNLYNAQRCLDRTVDHPLLATRVVMV